MVGLIIGRNGQVAQALAQIEHETNSFDLAPFVFLGSGEMDLRDSKAITAALEQYHPSFIINTAAYTAVDNAEANQEEAFLLNTKGPEQLALYCATHSIPFIHISSDYVYKGQSDAPYLETEPHAPLNIYGKTKAAGDEAVLKANPDAIILRTSWVYSPFGHNFVKTMLRLAQSKPTLSIVADQQGCPTSARQIASTIISCLQTLQTEGLGGKHAGVFHCCGAGDCSWYGFAVEIFKQAKALGLKTPQTVEPTTTQAYPTPAQRPSYSVLNTSKLKDVFGLTLAPWEQELSSVLQTLIQKDDQFQP